MSKPVFSKDQILQGVDDVEADCPIENADLRHEVNRYLRETLPLKRQGVEANWYPQPPAAVPALSAFMQPLTPSAALAAVVGGKAMPRTEVVKRLWAYINKNKLQDASNKRLIYADAKLKEVFGKPQVTMFEIAGLIGNHLK